MKDLQKESRAIPPLRGVHYRGEEATAHLDEIVERFGISLDQPTYAHSDPVPSQKIIVNTRTYVCRDGQHVIQTSQILPDTPNQQSADPQNFSVSIYECRSSSQLNVVTERED